MSTCKLNKKDTCYHNYQNIKYHYQTIYQICFQNVLNPDKCHHTNNLKCLIVIVHIQVKIFQKGSDVLQNYDKVIVQLSSCNVSTLFSCICVGLIWTAHIKLSEEISCAL